jgi:Transposase DDE domain
VSDPTPAGPPAPSRGLFRSLVLDPALLLARALEDEDLARAADEVAGPTRDRIFTPAVTAALFLAQVLSDDRSCRGVVARLLAWRAGRGLPACSPDAGGYCKARRRLPEALLPRLARQAADRLGAHAPPGWLFHGRRVLIVDGTTVTMPDTPENQAAFPQHFRQKPGCGSPIAQMVVLLCLATGCVLDAAIGRRVGKQTGEHALLRSLHGRLRPGDILLADAYYSSFDEVVALVGLGVDVVMRQVAGRKSDFRRGTKLSWGARTTS